MRKVLVTLFTVSLTWGGPAAGALHAQEEGARSDTVPRDTLTARDSARIRVQERLRALSKPPGAALDTARFDSAAVGRGPGGAAPPTSAVRQDGADTIRAALLELPDYSVTRYTGAGAEYDARIEILMLYGEEGLPEHLRAQRADPDPPAEPDTAAAGDTLQARPDTALPAAPRRDTLPVPDTVDLPTDTTDTLAAPTDTTAADRLAVPPGAAGPGPAGQEEPGVRAVLSGSDGSLLEAVLYIRYDQQRQTAAARGSTRFTSAEGGGDPVEADSLNVDVGGERASAFEARTRYAAGTANWNVAGNLPLVGEEVIYGDHARFTSCDLEIPHYHFEANEMKIVRGNIIVARPVKLYFADVPVAWLPFVAHSIPQGGRGSGLLTPRFSVNDIVRTSGSYRRRISNVGFYWAMSDYMDGTLAMDWFSDTYTAMTGSWRYRWLRQFLDGSVNVRRYWQANGSRQLAFDTQHRWEISERTRLNISARYASSSDFVRRNSFDPREVTQDIRSEGGISHRFDWGTLNVSARRKQSLSDDKVEQTLPNLSLSLNSITFFEAPPNRASWYNNITWNGGASLDRRTVDQAPDTLGFRFSTADVADLRASVNSSLGLGNFSFSQSMSVNQGSVFGVPRDSLTFFPDQVAAHGLAAFDGNAGRFELAQEAPGEEVDVADTEVSWNTGVSYQQSLIGSTTFTPRLQLSGRAFRSDTMEVAQDFVSAPTRVSFGARLKADVYGFYPGIGGFSAIRHKFSPSFSYDWSPTTDPTELQRQVFGVRAARPQRVLQVGFNQTWEAKRIPDEEESEASGTETGADTASADVPEEERAPGDEPAGIDQTPPEVPTGGAAGTDDEDGPRRLEQGQIMNLLSISTSMISYDFVEADSTGSFLQGFTSTTLRNQISSDFLRGLTISMSHDLFDDQRLVGVEESGRTVHRKFDPHLSSLNFGFTLNPSSTLLQWLGMGAGEGSAAAADDDEASDEPYDQRSATDETTILPGRGTDRDVREPRSGGPSRGAGYWNTRMSYSLSRPRGDEGRTSQMLQIGLNLNPTQQWEMSWNTSYDLEDSSFADHRVRLTRDLHRWQAHFDFLKTATGNWTFRFEVSLLDNDDLRFEHEQRSTGALRGGPGGPGGPR